MFIYFYHNFYFHSQNSNNSDQSSGYLSGGNGLPTNLSRVNGTPNNNNEYNYPPQPRLEDANETHNHHYNQGHMKCNKNSLKKLSLSSSLNGYSSSNNDHEMDFNNINRYVLLQFYILLYI